MAKHKSTNPLADTPRRKEKPRTVRVARAVWAMGLADTISDAAAVIRAGGCRVDGHVANTGLFVGAGVVLTTGRGMAVVRFG